MGIVANFLTGKIATTLTMHQMEREHAAWAETVTAGSVWYSKQPTSEWGRFGGHPKPVHDRYVFVKKGNWTSGNGWITAGGTPSWAIWTALCGTGLTQERQLTMTDCEQAAERLFDKQAAHMQQQIEKAVGWDPAWAAHVDRVLMSV